MTMKIRNVHPAGSPVRVAGIGTVEHGQVVEVDAELGKRLVQYKTFEEAESTPKRKSAQEGAER